MKTISELQQEIRNIQKNLQLLESRLKALDDDLVNFKEVAQENSLYQRVYELANGMPVIKHPLMQENQAVKNNYFAILIMIATLDDSINENQLLFLQRIIMDDPYNKWLNHYVEQIRKFKPENVVYNCDEAVKKKLAEQLLLDLLIIANLSYAKTNKTFELIAHIAAFLGINKDTAGHISEIAVTVLTQNIENYPCFINNEKTGEQNKLNLTGPTIRLATSIAKNLTKNLFGTINWDTPKSSLQFAFYEVVVEDNKKFGYYLSELPEWKDIVKKATQEKGNNYGYQKVSTIETDLKTSLYSDRELSDIYDKAYAYEMGVGVKKDKNMAMCLYRKAAELGHAAAIAKVHCEDSSIKADFKISTRDNKKASAIYRMAYDYEMGIGRKKDKNFAMCLYREAAKLGYEPAIAKVHCEDSLF
jgi:hypothetical protein